MRIDRFLLTFLGWIALGNVWVARGDIRVITPSGYLHGVPFLVRVEARDATGARNWNLWDEEATLASDQLGVTLSTNRISLRNGLGTALLTVSGSSDFVLRAEVNQEQAERAITYRGAQSVATVSGTLAGSSTRWSGIVKVTGTVTVPVGHTLTISSNTMVLIDGTASGTDGHSLVVRGAILSEGTELFPNIITCPDNTLNWGQIRHESSQPSLYRYTFISKAGRAPTEGHTGSAPAIKTVDSTLSFENSVISDFYSGTVAIGKVMMASGSTLTFNDSVLARARMGPEIASTGLLFTNSYIMEMRGPDDADGIYLHDSGSRPLTLSGSVIVGGDDDAIDTLDSKATVENCILRDWPNPNEDAKGLSAFNGEVALRHCLIANCFAGVSAKSSGPLAVLRLDHCTITAIDRGVSAATKANASAGNINIFMTNSIVFAGDALYSDFGPEKFVSVTYCDLEEPWPGLGNINFDPLFVNRSSGDFHLQPGSPSIDAGDPASPSDPNGSRTDIGFYTGLSLSGFSVNITSPSAGATFASPATIQLNATTFSSAGLVDRVEFYQGTTRLGEDLASPFSLTWSNVTSGVYTLRAVATLPSGLLATSAPVIISVTVPVQGPTTNVLIHAGSDWKYLDDGSNQGTAWKEPPFVDSDWKINKAQLGYGDGDEATVIGFGPNSNDKYVTYYFRRDFVLDDLSRVQSLSINLLRDDGAIVYLNGQEAYRSNISSGPVNYRTYARSSGDFDWQTNSVSPSLLRSGTNLVAVEVHQADNSSSDLSFDLELQVVLVSPPNAGPAVVLTSPATDLVLVAPASLTVTADAADADGSVTNVAFFASGNKLGGDNLAPFTVSWSDIALGTYALTAVATDNLGLSSTSAPVNVTVSEAPIIASYFPESGIVTNLSEIIVNFSKAVRGVDAADLLLNGVPARNLSGAGSNYVFGFPPRSAGTTVVSWSASHAIGDTLTPPIPFNASAPEATWQYQVVDTLAPNLANIIPARGTVQNLSSITVEFNEPVSGLNASDLLVKSVPASAVVGSGAGPYTFSVAQPPKGPVTVTWAAGHGISDAGNNLFAGTTINYLLDPALFPVVINEIMYHPASENPLEEYIELYNLGPSLVNLQGWRFSDGVDFTFPNISIGAGNYLVVAADLTAFRAKYPGVANVIGNWTGTLSNSREDIDLDNAQGQRVDSVRYSDEGDWGVRRRGLNDRAHRGWIWSSDHDGFGPSAELINPHISNNNGQNWAASAVLDGTPGQANSIRMDNIAPLIASVTHLPMVPKSTDSVVISARVTDEVDAAPAVELSYRPDNLTPLAFTVVPMRDDGTEGDAFPGDGIFSARVPPQTNSVVVEFFVSARDSGGRSRTWPAPAIPSADGQGPSGQIANALYQVDDSIYEGTQPLYKIVMTEAERLELEGIGNNFGGTAGSDAQMNATFISIDGTGSQLRYLTGVRNRGHGTRAAKPNNFRVSFRNDDEWKGVIALNLNAQFTWLQVLGSALNLKSGIAGAYSRPVQLRVNNQNLVFTGGIDRTYGSYAANEAINSDWADRHFPNDSEGNIYRAIRDIVPSDFDYRVTNIFPQLYGPENKNSYTNTWFKESNESEDDWSDLIGLVRVFGTNGTVPFTRENLGKVINIEQWLRHLALMNLLGNSETGLSSGFNDDYFMYRGVEDPRFILMYYDMDQILGFNGSFGTVSTLFSAVVSSAAQGAGAPLNRFLHHPEFEPLYYGHLKNLLETSLSAPEFDELVDQTLGDFVPETTRTQLKNWMEARRTYVLSQLPVITPATAPIAVVTGTPRSPSPSTSSFLEVGGKDITHYRFKLNDGEFGPQTPVDVAISLSGLRNGTNTVAVIGRNAAGQYQSETDATIVSWVVNNALPTVRLNEVLAARSGNLPDQIELYNDGPSAVNLAGMRLTDNPAQPGKFTFGAVTLASRAYLVLDQNQLGFGFDSSGEGVFLFASAALGGDLVDSVKFGPQIQDLSIGRLGTAGDWRLTQPTLGLVNRIQPLGLTEQIRINEWSTLGLPPYPDDFIELYNPALLPVAIGGLYLTDEPIGAPRRNFIAPLSFIPARGFAVFNTGSGNSPDEIGFGLAGEQGEIALLDAGLQPIDFVVYGPQRSGVSSGRCPDGAPTIKALTAPTPAGPNQCPVVPPPPEVRPLLPYNDTWKYAASGADLGTAWKETGFDDSSWNSALGPLGFETDFLPEPLRTFLPDTGAITYYFRKSFELDLALAPSSIQITHLVDDGAAFYLNGNEISRFNLPLLALNQTFAASTRDATLQSFTIPADQLLPGANTFAVEVHQSGRNSGDLVFGLKMDALVVTNNPADAGIVINEILADNASLEEADGSKPDWVELYNPSANTVDLGGMTLSDSLANPARWTFAAGTFIPATGFLKVRFDPDTPVSSTNAGFGLKNNGGSVYLFNRAADGGNVQSSATYGLQAPDWSIGRVPDGNGPWVLTLPTLGMSNLVATLGNPGLLKINEWMAEPSSGEDWFEIFNPNPEPVDLSGLALSDSLSSPLKHIIAPLSFIGSGPQAFQEFVADDDLAAGADHVNFKLGATGEALAISMGTGVLIDGISFGPQVKGVSQGRLLDGSSNIVSFAGSASPRSSNFLPLEEIVINELLSHSDLPLEDAVELYNPTAAPVDVSGWFLSDSAFNLRQYQISANTVIPAHGYRVLYENQFNSDLSKLAFSSAKGDDVYLSQALGGELTGYRAAASFGPAESGVSFGRVLTSQGYHFVPLGRRTFGKDTPATVEEFRLGTGALNATAKTGPVVFSEIMYNPSGGNDTLEFVELQNITDAAVPLYDTAHPENTWHVRKGIEFDFPPGTILPARGFLVLVSFDPQGNLSALAAFQGAYGSSAVLVGPYNGKLDNSGETIQLLKTDAPQTGLVPYIVVDEIDYGTAAPWSAASTGASLHKINPALYGNDPVNWAGAAPTPGRSDTNDSDNDGLPDEFETANGFNPNNPADASTDADGDGSTNLQEYLAGTNPRNTSDSFRIESTAVSTGGVTLRFRTAAGRSYSILYSENSPAGPWQKLSDVTPSGAPGFIEIVEPMPVSRSGFYKIVSPAAP